MTATTTVEAPTLAWWRVFRRYTGLHVLYLARKHLGVAAPGDDRVREEAGETAGLWWLIRIYESGPQRRYRVTLLPHARPQPTERWVTRRVDACGWVLLMHLEPAWALMTGDGENPWPLLRAVSKSEIDAACDRCWPDDPATRDAVLNVLDERDTTLAHAA